MERELLTITEAAKRIGVSATTLRKWSNAGIIETERLPGSGYRRYDADAIDAFIEKMKEESRGKLAA